MARPAAGPARGNGETPPARLGEALEQFLKSSGIRNTSEHPELFDIWRRIVGPDIACHTGVVSFKKGVLEVAVDSSALMNDIEFHRAALLRDLRNEFKKPFVQRISFVLKPMQDES